MSLVVTDHCKVYFVEGMKLIPPILAALIASRTIWAGTRGWYRRRWGSHQVWRKRLNLLANGATAECVEELLGTPIFKNDEPSSIWKEDDEKPKWVDHIFSNAARVGRDAKDRGRACRLVRDDHRPQILVEP
jgi:hypothetical protein